MVYTYVAILARKMAVKMKLNDILVIRMFINIDYLIKINLKYLLSFGQINEPFFMKDRFSTLYWSASSLINQIFPNQFEIEIFHIINTSFGLNVAIKKGVFKNTRVSIEYSLPSYMSYSGVQVGNFNDFILNLQYSPGGHKNH